MNNKITAIPGFRLLMKLRDSSKKTPNTIHRSFYKICSTIYLRIRIGDEILDKLEMLPHSPFQVFVDESNHKVIFLKKSIENENYKISAKKIINITGKEFVPDLDEMKGKELKWEYFLDGIKIYL